MTAAVTPTVTATGTLAQPNRPQARHCPELLGSSATPADLLAQFARAGEKVARLLADRISTMGDRSNVPVMHCLPVQECSADALADLVAPLAGNCLLGAQPGATDVLVSFQAQGVLHLLDCSFGGTGEIASPLPEAFPHSAELMLSRLEAAAASALTTAFGVEMGPRARSAHFADLPALAKVGRLAMVQIEATQPNGTDWTITVATSLAALGAFFDQAERGPARRTEAHSATGETFGEVPLTLNAVLVDMRMALSALSDLRPGHVMPVSVARSVPLRVGGSTIAHGTIGALDDRVALQLTQTF